ncbi:serine-threonine protein kinase [Carcinus maenas nudivirus]|uniref:non-specific serine/threonine protein kinase n=1 Tax=Carcinus maenas nudivirus TaxID=2880837 RepID=A0AAE8Y052_9VIRU|nr:serine-threonine protein kinase [Carcinus maenas nudivirus]UBZ25611.1 serine-threonine protein kinase [Carcinus maenas nudivirus]
MRMIKGIPINILSSRKVPMKKTRSQHWKKQVIEKVEADKLKNVTNDSILINALVNRHAKLLHWIKSKNDSNKRPSIKELRDCLKSIVKIRQTFQMYTPVSFDELSNEFRHKEREMLKQQHNNDSLLCNENVKQLTTNTLSMKDMQNDNKGCEELTQSMCDRINANNIPLLNLEYMANLKIKKHIGKGGYGSCVVAFNGNTNQWCVIKTFSCGNDLQEMITEAVMITKLKQNFGIQELVGIYVTECQMVTKYAGKTLFDVLNKQMVSTDTKYTIAYKLSNIIYKNIKKGFLHNDIKETNICLTSSYKPRLIDFGLATKINSLCRFVNDKDDPKNYPNIAPELCTKYSRCTEASEVYSLLKCIDVLKL